MKALYLLEAFSRELNDYDRKLPASRSRCFDIGTGGGCGPCCPVFVEGECSEPQEITKQDVIDAQGDDAPSILKLYDCYNQKDGKQ